MGHFAAVVDDMGDEKRGKAASEDHACMPFWALLGPPGGSLAFVAESMNASRGKESWASS
eukprot:CAMPEP_0180199372 /NCGR_PEP_ID=MMETSP0987-20121128/5679_1 /TAXON_ID=697907 /ORGANISM="non described non described, Strain CCMP2293" /LENGTH=59 /DNA_ID=CAMNT_0022154463 /DNA_START=373 /DNA_END=553 /DNA_ORIENTATION=+